MIESIDLAGNLRVSVYHEINTSSQRDDARNVAPRQCTISGNGMPIDLSVLALECPVTQ